MTGETRAVPHVPAGARYDGYADWFESYNAPVAARDQGLVTGLIGPGQGDCLDLGCGPGLYFDAIRAAGRDPLGLDFSADQLRLALPRGRCVQADAAALPFADGRFPAVLMTWISTDVDDFAAVVREAARVLRPGGLLAFFGAHPCFSGPHVEYREDDTRVVHPTYRLAAWHEPQPWWGDGGPRSRVGIRHVPLAQFLHAFIDTGLVLEQVIEPKPRFPVPGSIALRLTRPA